MAYVSPHLLNWYEDRAKFVDLELVGIDPKTGTETPVDLSAATAAVRLRVWKSPTLSRAIADALVDVEMDIDSDGTGGNEARVSTLATIVSGAGRVGPIECEVVIVDESATGQPTPTTYGERVAKAWGSADGARLHPSIQP